MKILYIISQIVGFSAFIISLIAYHRKEKKKIFKTMMIANILDIIHYFLLGAYSGCVTKVMALIRNEIIIVKEKRKKLNNIIVLIIIVFVYVIAGVLTYENIYSILPILAAVIYMFFVWNGDELKVKKVAFYCYFLWLAYNMCVFSVAGIVSNSVAIISTFIAMLKEKKDKEKIKNGKIHNSNNSL